MMSGSNSKDGALRDSNLSRFAGVSEAGVPDARAFRVAGWEAGARRRNPEPAGEGSLHRSSFGKMARPERFELPAF